MPALALEKQQSTPSAHGAVAGGTDFYEKVRGFLEIAGSSRRWFRNKCPSDRCDSEDETSGSPLTSPHRAPQWPWEADSIGRAVTVPGMGSDSAGRCLV